jgi:hypothetical protein
VLLLLLPLLVRPLAARLLLLLPMPLLPVLLPTYCGSFELPAFTVPRVLHAGASAGSTPLDTALVPSEMT